MSDHNGWSTYATWRVVSEFARNDVELAAEEEVELADALALGRWFKDHVEGWIYDIRHGAEKEFGKVGEMIVLYAQAFVDDVDWKEIGEAHWEQYLKLRKESASGDTEGDT